MCRGITRRPFPIRSRRSAGLGRLAYHAGTKGPSAKLVSTGPRPLCYTNGTCSDTSLYRDYVENAGLANYRGGEEVLNTELETRSWMAKATLRFDDAQVLQFGYTGFRSEAGDLRASGLSSESSQATQQANTAGTVVDTFTTRYRWTPADNDLVDLKANLWLTNLELRNPPRSSMIPESIGLSPDFRTGSDATMWGADATNTSRFSFDSYGSLGVTYGLSYLNEDTSPTPHAWYLDLGFTPRDGERQEAATFAKVAYDPVDWLTLNGGLRYAHFWSHDRAIPANINTINPKPDRSDGGFSPSAGITLKPAKGVQLYANYSNVLRFPEPRRGRVGVLPHGQLGCGARAFQQLGNRGELRRGRPACR